MANLILKSPMLCRQVLEAVPEHIALIDSRGTLVGVNTAWEKFSDENGGNRAKTGIGANYFEVCRRAMREGAKEAGAVLEELQRVIAGNPVGQEILYPCHSPREQRWFVAKAVRIFSDGEPFAAILHSNATVRTLLQNRLRELRQSLMESRRKLILEEWLNFLAHEVTNPLSAVLLRGQMLKRLLSTAPHRDPKLLSHCDSILEMTQRALQMIGSSRASLAVDPGPLETFIFRDLLEDLAVISKGWLGSSGVHIESNEIPRELTVHGHRLRLSLALLSVLLYFSSAGDGSVSIQAQGQDHRLRVRFQAKRLNTPPATRLDLRIAEKLMAFELGEIAHETRGLDESVELTLPNGPAQSAKQEFLRKAG